MILPAIIPKSITDLRSSLDKVSFSDAIQIDVVDGKFVDNISWPYYPKGDVSDITFDIKEKNIEIDLMVFNPISAAHDWLNAGAKTLVFHIESLSENFSEVFDLKNKYNFKLGLSLNNDTSISLLYPYASDIDFVQLMGIAKIGVQGQPFDSRVLDRIITLRALYPNLLISIDGGVNLDTIEILKKTGVNRFVVGSAILNSPQPKDIYEEMLKITLS